MLDKDDPTRMLQRGSGQFLIPTYPYETLCEGQPGCKYVNVATSSLFLYCFTPDIVNDLIFSPKTIIGSCAYIRTASSGHEQFNTNLQQTLTNVDAHAWAHGCMQHAHAPVHIYTHVNLNMDIAKHVCEWKAKEQSLCVLRMKYALRHVFRYD